MYKDIIRWVIDLIFKPAKTWELLAKKEETQEEFLSRFLYPLIGLVTAVAFVGVLFTQKEFDLELALKSSIRTLVSYFGGFYLGAYLMNEIWHGLFKRERNMKLWVCFVGYSSSLMYALDIVLTLLPDFFFLQIFFLYTFYIIWEGSGSYMQVEENARMKFVWFTTFVVLLAPFIVEKLLSMLMPGLSF